VKKSGLKIWETVPGGSGSATEEGGKEGNRRGKKRRRALLEKSAL